MSASRRALVGGGLLFAALLLAGAVPRIRRKQALEDRKSTRLNSSHGYISYAVFCLKKKKTNFNGCNLGSAYGDNAQPATNVPHVRLPINYTVTTSLHLLPDIPTLRVCTRVSGLSEC